MKTVLLALAAFTIAGSALAQPAAPEAGPPNYLANEAKDHTLAWSASVTPAGAASFKHPIKSSSPPRRNCSRGTKVICGTAIV